MSGYAHPEVLVDTAWVADHLNDPKVRIVESDEDVLLYETGHIPGAVKIDWVTDLNDPVVRDYLDAERFAEVLASKGISNDTTVVFYGDKHNWWATYAFWVFKLFGHQDARILNGGRARWIAEGRELTREVPTYPRGSTSRRRAMMPLFAPSATRFLSTSSVLPARRWWMCAARRSSAASAPICQSTPRRAPCAAAISLPPSIFPGPRPCARTAPSKAPKSCARSTRQGDYAR